MPILYAILVTVIVGIGSFFAGSMYGAKDCKADVRVRNAKAETTKAKGDAKSAERSGKRGTERATDAGITAPIQQEIQNDVQANPAPIVCRTPAERLRNLNRLIDEANAPAGVHPARRETQAPADGHAERGGAVDSGHGAEVPRAQQELSVPAGVERKQ